MLFKGKPQPLKGFNLKSLKTAAHKYFLCLLRKYDEHSYVFMLLDIVQSKLSMKYLKFLMNKVDFFKLKLSFLKMLLTYFKLNLSYFKRFDLF